MVMIQSEAFRSARRQLDPHDVQKAGTGGMYV